MESECAEKRWRSSNFEKKMSDFKSGVHYIDKGKVASWMKGYPPSIHLSINEHLEGTTSRKRIDARGVDKKRESGQERIVLTSDATERTERPAGDDRLAFLFSMNPLSFFISVLVAFYRRLWHIWHQRLFFFVR